MSERSIRIHIGGDLKDVAGFCNAASADGATSCNGIAPSTHIELSQCMEGNHLVLYRTSRYAQFIQLEQFCVEQHLSYMLFAPGTDEMNECAVVWIPGMTDRRMVYADAIHGQLLVDEMVVIRALESYNLSEVRHILQKALSPVRLGSLPNFRIIT